MSEFNLNEFFSSLPCDREVYTNGNELFRSPDYPTIFYIGKGKTGSSALAKNIKNAKVAHWHSTAYYEYIHTTKNALAKRNLTVYDFVEWINENIHPVKVIEAYRDPIAQYLSALAQWGLNPEYELYQKMLDVRYPKITFQKELEKPSSSLEVIYLKTENSNNWSEVLAEHGIEFNSTITNINKSIEYRTTVNRICLPKWQLDIIYSDEKVQELYTKEEIEQFYEKWSY